MTASSFKTLGIILQINQYKSINKYSQRLKTYINPCQPCQWKWKRKITKEKNLVRFHSWCYNILEAGNWKPTSFFYNLRGLTRNNFAKLNMIICTLFRRKSINSNSAQKLDICSSRQFVALDGWHTPVWIGVETKLLLRRIKGQFRWDPM